MLNSNAALGLSKGKAADNSATWGAMFQSQVERCWKKPYGGIEAQRAEAAFTSARKLASTLSPCGVAFTHAWITGSRALTQRAFSCKPDGEVSPSRMM